MGLKSRFSDRQITRSPDHPIFLLITLPPPRSTLFPYTALFRSFRCPAVPMPGSLGNSGNHGVEVSVFRSPDHPIAGSTDLFADFNYQLTKLTNYQICDCSGFPMPRCPDARISWQFRQPWG